MEICNILSALDVVISHFIACDAACKISNLRQNKDFREVHLSGDYLIGEVCVHLSHDVISNNVAF